MDPEYIREIFVLSGKGAVHGYRYFFEMRLILITSGINLVFTIYFARRLTLSSSSSIRVRFLESEVAVRSGCWNKKHIVHCLAPEFFEVELHRRVLRIR